MSDSTANEDFLDSGGYAAAPGADESADPPPYGVPGPVGTGGSTGWRGALRPAAWLAAGVVGGAVVVAAWHTSQSATPLANPAAAQGQLPGGGQAPNGQAPNGQAPNGQAPNGQGGAPGFGGGPGFDGQGRGGRPGEQHVQGTVTVVGGSSVTVRLASGGSATYTVVAASDIVKNGARVPLSSIKAGDTVFMHVYPLNGRIVVEHLFAGTGAPGGPGRPGPAPGDTTTEETTTTTT